MDWEWIKGLFCKTLRQWLNDDAIIDSAALSFYFVLSLPALLLFSVSLGSIFLRSKQLQNNLISFFNGIVDERIIEMLEMLFEEIPTLDSLSLSVLAGFIVLLWSASNIFRHLKKFIEKIWGVPSAGTGFVSTFLRNAGMSFLSVLIFVGILFVNIIVRLFLFVGADLFGSIIPFSVGTIGYVNSVSTFLVLFLLFVFIYRVLPDVKIGLKPVIVGSLVTVVLISIGQYLIGLYLTHSGPSTVYGAMGSIIGLFLWIYYTSMMITFGAEFTKIYSEH